MTTKLSHLENFQQSHFPKNRNTLFPHDRHFHIHRKPIPSLISHPHLPSELALKFQQFIQSVASCFPDIVHNRHDPRLQTVSPAGRLATADDKKPVCKTHSRRSAVFMMPWLSSPSSSCLLLPVLSPPDQARGILPERPPLHWRENGHVSGEAASASQQWPPHITSSTHPSTLSPAPTWLCPGWPSGCCDCRIRGKGPSPLPLDVASPSTLIHRLFSVEQNECSSSQNAMRHCFQADRPPPLHSAKKIQAKVVDF